MNEPETVRYYSIVNAKAEKVGLSVRWYDEALSGGKSLTHDGFHVVPKETPARYPQSAVLAD